MSKYGVLYHEEEGTYDVLKNKGFQGMEHVASFGTEEEAQFYVRHLIKLDEIAGALEEAVQHISSLNGETSYYERVLAKAKADK